MKGLYRLFSIVALCVCALMISASYSSAAPSTHSSAEASKAKQTIQTVTADAAVVDLAQAMHEESAGIYGGLMKYEFVRSEPSFEVVKTSEGFARPIDHVPN